jgi:hypothetical protein
MTTAAEAVREPFQDLIRRAVGDSALIGFDNMGSSQPGSYAAMHLYGSSLFEAAGRRAAGSLAP